MLSFRVTNQKLKFPVACFPSSVEPDRTIPDSNLRPSLTPALLLTVGRSGEDTAHTSNNVALNQSETTYLLL